MILFQTWFFLADVTFKKKKPTGAFKKKELRRTLLECFTLSQKQKQLQNTLIHSNWQTQKTCLKPSHDFSSLLKVRSVYIFIVHCIYVFPHPTPSLREADENLQLCLAEQIYGVNLLLPCHLSGCPLLSTESCWTTWNIVKLGTVFRRGYIESGGSCSSKPSFKTIGWVGMETFANGSGYSLSCLPWLTGMAAVGLSVETGSQFKWKLPFPCT